MNGTLYLDDLMKIESGLDHFGRMWLSGRCHPGVPMYAYFEEMTETIHLVCSECDNVVVDFAIASRRTDDG